MRLGLFLRCCGALAAFVAGKPLNASDVQTSIAELVTAGRADLAKSPVFALQKAEARKQQHQGDSLSDQAQTAVADWISAAALVHLNRPANANALANEGLKINAKVLRSAHLEGELRLALANGLTILGRVQSALDQYQKAYHKFREVKFSRGQALALQDIAANYINAGDYETAVRYCREALSTFSSEPLLTYSMYNNLGIALVGLGKYKAAEGAYESALAAAKYTGRQLIIAKVYENLARSQIDAGDERAAETTLSRGYKITSSGDAAGWRPVLNEVAARLALKKGEVKRAEDLIQLAESATQVADVSSTARDFHRTAFEVYKAAGDSSKALNHLEAFKKLDDQARALAASTNAALMSARFDFANQDLKITRLRVGQAERDAALARTQGRFHSALIGGLAFISVLLLLGFVSIRRSRNQVRAANRDLQDSNAELEKALAAKSIFLATTSHEIRTPLNGILGMTQVLLADRQLQSDVRNRVQLIHGSGETMRALVDDILDMAKIETGELRLHPAAMDLKQLLADAGTVWAGQAQTKTIGLALQLNDCPVGIVADEVRLRQIVFNLMSNAIKFTDRGQVRLSAHAEPCGEGEQLVIRIQDSGVGIPADRLADIFESFRQVDGGVTRRHGGTGLGLAICRNLARAMGGDVTVSSVLGTGSSFTVTLPLERTQIAAAPTSEAAVPAATLAEARLLLLEPNPLAQGILRALLTPHVATLEVASDEEAASTWLEQGGFHHLLMDAAAFGFDPEAFGRFRTAHEVAHVTLLWPSPTPEVQAAIAAWPGVRLLAKPIAAPDLLAGLRMSYHPAEAGRDIAA